MAKTPKTSNKKIIEAWEWYQKEVNLCRSSWKTLAHNQPLIGRIGLEILEEFGFPACGELSWDISCLLFGRAIGRYVEEADFPYQWTIQLSGRAFSNELSKIQKVGLLIHEWTHLLLGHTGFPETRLSGPHSTPKYFKADSPWYEPEAEAVAVMTIGPYWQGCGNEYKEALEHDALLVAKLDTWPMGYDPKPLVERMRRAVGKHFPVKGD